MAQDVKVPSLGESITEVQISGWLKAPGDHVKQDEPLAEIDSDKATVELPSPCAGRLTAIKVAAGEFCRVGDVIAVIDETATAPSGASEKPAAAPGAAPVVMPAAQRVIAQSGVDAATVTGTGPGGRVLKEDAQRAAAAKAPAPAPAPAPVAPPAPPAPTGAREDRVVPMSPIRRRIAERLVQSQQIAALLTTFNEIDMSAVLSMRKLHQESFQAKYGVKLGFMSFFARATIEALRLVPQLNAEIREQSIVYHDYHDIGIAIGSGKGLVVPVIRNAERLSFGGIEQAIADFAQRAQNKKLDLAELEGGTFTISNGGVYGSLLSTPIVNPPQSGVLGLHAIQDRAVVRGGEIVVRPMMYVALTYDHRLVDGREAVTFLKHVKECVEQPERLLLEI
jgi:2-oxoglutarate dehydrogenase E2 component (dihydrolipoamide succinyltransferase)